MLKKITPFIFLFFLSGISSSNDDSLSSIDNLQKLDLAVIFCLKGTDDKRCNLTNRQIYNKSVVPYKDLPFFTKKLADASVHLRAKYGGCTGAIVKLKRGRKSCKKAPYHLITGGHCVTETMEDGSIFYEKDIKIKRTKNKATDFNLSFSKNLEDLTNPPYCSLRTKDCILDIQELGSDYKGIDQAILPLSQKNLPKSIKPLEIDIQNMISKKEWFQCLREKKNDIFFSYIFTEGDIKTFGLNTSHLGSQVFKCEGSRLYDKYETFGNFVKPMLDHKCPIIRGFSGALGHTKCGKKQALFISSYHKNSLPYEQNYKNNTPVPYRSYYDPDINHNSYYNRNFATHLNSELLDLYFKRICEDRSEFDHALFDAAYNGDTAAIDELLRQGAKINAKNKSGKTPLHAAAQRGDIATIDTLLKHGADIDAVGKNGWTPLHMAAQRKNADAYQLLLQKGADPDIKDRWGQTAEDLL